MVAALETLGRLTSFALRSLAALPSALIRPRRLAVPLYDVLIGALPLALTAGAAIGVVVWLHLAGR